MPRSAHRDDNGHQRDEHDPIAIRHPLPQDGLIPLHLDPFLNAYPTQRMEGLKGKRTNDPSGPSTHVVVGSNEVERAEGMTVESPVARRPEGPSRTYVADEGRQDELRNDAPPVRKG